MRSDCRQGSRRFRGLTFWFVFTLSTLSSQAFAAVTVTAPLAGVVNSPFLLRAQSTSCSSQSTTSMAYSIDDHTDTVFKGATSLDTDVAVSNGSHTLHVKAWGNAGALCKTDVVLTVGGGVIVSAPQHRVVVNSPFLLRAQATTCGGQPTSSMAYSFDSTGDTLVSGATSIDRTISVSNGSHILRVKAWGNSGAFCNTNSDLTVGGGVVITTPSNGATVSSPFNLQANATTCGGQSTSSMAFSLDSNTDNIVHGATSLNTSVSGSNGSHILRVKAWGNSGAFCEGDRDVTVSGASQTAAPDISLDSGTYVMPQSTTISDSTSGATILWCYATIGTCTPSTTYSGSIYINPAATETICANATASGYTQSATVCNYYVTQTQNPQAAAPDFNPSSGTPPVSVTISDDTPGAAIQWCSVTSGSCTPSIAYSGPITVNSPETICANANASGYTQSDTACASYNAPGSVTFTQDGSGNVTMSTDIPNTQIFYTVDGSTPTEGSILYSGPVPLAAGTVINAIPVLTSNNGNSAMMVQGGQKTASNWKTVLATSSAPSWASTNYNSPNVRYCSSGSCGVKGTPWAISFLTSQLPHVGDQATATLFNFTTEGYDASHNATGAANQVLWPYDVGNGGCPTCTTMIQDFYIWPQNTAAVNPANVENWELDMNSWNQTGPSSADGSGYLGASFQCSNNGHAWEYNGQVSPGWTVLYADGPQKTQKLNHDCQLPFGTLTNAITSTDEQFTVTPDVTGTITAATVEDGMIVLVDNEEIFCHGANGNTCTNAERGWAGTTRAAHSVGAKYSGSVHVQYHVTFKPGDTSVCKKSSTDPTPVECIFIDYLALNNQMYDFHQIYGEQTVGGVSGYSALTVPATSLSPNGYSTRIFDQKQIDVKPGVGSTTNPVAVGEFIDQDNVTASWGIPDGATQSSYTVH